MMIISGSVSSHHKKTAHPVLFDLVDNAFKRAMVPSKLERYLTKTSLNSDKPKDYFEKLRFSRIRL